MMNSEQKFVVWFVIVERKRVMHMNKACSNSRKGSRAVQRTVSVSYGIIRMRMLLLFIFVLCSVFVFGMFAFKSNAKQEYNAYKYYTSIQIAEGDTLWSIADSYCSDGYETRDDFIQEVKELNHIDEDSIHAGNYLTVPYYSSEQK
jgi:cell division protein YceG involved in septum cleavage